LLLTSLGDATAGTGSCDAVGRTSGEDGAERGDDGAEPGDDGAERGEGGRTQRKDTRRTLGLTA
ncbi:hypothetical protein, partial [Sinomonas sp.]|uniref:hypothetical protein n=1 Tax=Sinomonas sp. TaxID=1914986 RepID=UPI003F80D468